MKFETAHNRKASSGNLILFFLPQKSCPSAEKTFRGYAYVHRRRTASCTRFSRGLRQKKNTPGKCSRKSLRVELLTHCHHPPGLGKRIRHVKEEREGWSRDRPGVSKEAPGIHAGEGGSSVARNGSVCGRSAIFPMRGVENRTHVSRGGGNPAARVAVQMA